MPTDSPTAGPVLEHAVLEVVPGQEIAFEEAFAKAKAIISSAVGFRSLRLGRCLEAPSRYLLLVEWERLADHTEGFRGSAGYQEWKKLLHHFYEPFPVVDHYDERVMITARPIA
jgi:heme-degrading monooxygenase HmoA